MSPIAITLLIFAIVIIRVGYRAYMAYTHQFKTWPIIVGLGVVYALVAVGRYFLGLNGPAFLIVSLACYYGSYLLYKQGMKQHNANQSYTQ
jgi:hypothetical protein